MGTTGTITGVARYLKEVAPQVCITGLQPAENSQIPGSAAGHGLSAGFFSRSWWMIFWISHSRKRKTPCANWRNRKDFLRSQFRRCGGRCPENCKVNPGAVIVAVICDRGDRYLDRRFRLRHYPAVLPVYFMCSSGNGFPSPSSSERPVCVKPIWW